MSSLSHRQLFLTHLAQTSPQPMGIEVERAEGIYLYTPEGEKYTDLISGISVSNVGHSHPAVIHAVAEQAGRYMHTMVYGEHIQSPQVQFAQKLTSHLPQSLSNVYFVNSGSEANEGALKLAKRATGRTKIIYCKHAYHGSTHGALSIMGDEERKSKIRPLLPDVHQIRFNNFEDLQHIDRQTAAIILEPLQAEAGAITPAENYLRAVKKRTQDVGALLIFDEVQTGFGRLGALFALDLYETVPDILTLAKAMGGGMPIGAFVASQNIMNTLSESPTLGHITTFGGHPVCAAAGLAAFDLMIENKLFDNARQRGLQFKKLLQSEPEILEIRGEGLLLALELGSFEKVEKFIDLAYQDKLLIDFFLFCNTALRLAPPLIVTEEQVEQITLQIKNILSRM